MKIKMKKIFVHCTLCIAICLLSACGFDETDSPGMVWIEPGTFMMGNNGDPGSGGVFDDRERPTHQVTLTKGFYMSRYLITQELYHSIMADVEDHELPARFRPGDRLPAEGLSWYEAIVFCNKLSIREGLTPVYSISKDNSYPYNTNMTTNPDE